MKLTNYPRWQFSSIFNCVIGGTIYATKNEWETIVKDVEKKAGKEKTIISNEEFNMRIYLERCKQGYEWGRFMMYCPGVTVAGLIASSHGLTNYQQRNYVIQVL